MRGPTLCNSEELSKNESQEKLTQKENCSGKPHYLIVDDEAVVRDCLGLLFECNAHITYARDGVEAIALTQRHNFDLIICDVQMPRLDGISFFKKLNATTPSISDKFIFCTGYTTNSFRRFCREQRVSFCHKPINPDEMILAVQEKMNILQPNHH